MPSCSGSGVENIPEGSGPETRDVPGAGLGALFAALPVPSTPPPLLRVLPPAHIDVHVREIPVTITTAVPTTVPAAVSAVIVVPTAVACRRRHRYPWGSRPRRFLHDPRAYRGRRFGPSHLRRGAAQVTARRFGFFFPPSRVTPAPRLGTGCGCWGCCCGCSFQKSAVFFSISFRG